MARSMAASISASFSAWKMEFSERMDAAGGGREVVVRQAHRRRIGGRTTVQRSKGLRIKRGESLRMRRAPASRVRVFILHRMKRQPTCRRTIQRRDAAAFRKAHTRRGYTRPR